MGAEEGRRESRQTILLDGLSEGRTKTRHRPGTKFIFACPVCGDDGAHGAVIKYPDGWGISCWRCPDGGDYIKALAKAVGCTQGGYALLDDPLAHLGDLVQRRSSSRPAAGLPTHATIIGWHARLTSSGDPLNYLKTERGLSDAVIERFKIGWDGEAFTLPIYSIKKRRLVNLRRRSWPDPFPDGARYKGLPGRTKRNGGVQLYPDVPAGGGLLLCGGEFDALVARRHGVPGITSTAGAAVRWKSSWLLSLKGRRVVVAFDVGEEAIADKRVNDLRGFGAEAWSIDLRDAGLSDKEDLTDWFVKYKRTADDLRGLVRKARPQSGASGGRV